MRPAAFASVFVLALLGCSRPAAGGPGQGEPKLAAVTSAAPAAVPLIERRVDTLPDRPWIGALRMERWSDALSAIDSEPPEIRARPEVKYAAAAAAERLGQYARVVELLNDLEAELPVLGERIRARRARAALSARQATFALDYYKSRTDAESRLKFAEAQAVMGDRAAARASVTALLAKVPGNASRCNVEAKGRRLLSELLPEDAPALIARELRWLAVQAPLCESSLDADERLDTLGPAHALTKSERLERARAFATNGDVERAELELAAVGKARGAPPDAAAILAIRGLARYAARRELDQATELLLRAAKGNPARAAEWIHTAARARMRAGDTDEAVALLDRVQKTAPNTSLAELAEYKRAQLMYAAGRFEQAVRAYDAYLARYGKRARYMADATDERAVAWVVTGNASRAALAFAELARPAKRHELSRYRLLEAVALQYAGQSERAVSGYKQVMLDHPLSFAALAASARLELLGVPAPPIPAAAAASTSAAELLVALPPESDLLHRIGLDREAELALAGVERKVAQSFSGHADQALCMLYRRLASAESCYRVGQSAATWEELQVAPRSDRRWLWECVYPRPYAELVSHHAALHGVDSDLIYAVMRQESGFRPEVVSPARAIGLLQIMPSTGEKLAGELGVAFDPEYLRQPPVNVRLGAHYLRKLLDVFDGSLPLAVASYNAGPTAVLRWLDGARTLDIDLFVARIPYGETRAYVERVLSNYARYRYLTGGEAAVPRLALKLPVAKTEGVDLF